MLFGTSCKKRGTLLSLKTAAIMNPSATAPLLFLIATVSTTTTSAFVVQPQSSTLIRASSSSSSSSLKMNDKPEIEVVSQPSKDFLEKKGVFNWGTWGCPASKFPWTYDSTESCYLLKGKVTVTPSDGRKEATFGKGDFVTFPAGMSCTWDVQEDVEKHFMFF